MPVRVPAAPPIVCPRCHGRMGVWKSNCLRCDAAIPLPAAAGQRPQHRRPAVGIGLGVIVAVALGVYASSLVPRIAFAIPDHASPLLTPLNRMPFQRTRVSGAHTGVSGRAHVSTTPTGAGRRLADPPPAS